MLIGAASILYKNRSKLTGKIVFLFQPAEETKGGADDIVAEGILRDIGVQYIFAQHVAPHQSVGTISISPGATLAGSTSFHVVVTGDESHAAQPHSGDDVVVAASKIVQGLAEIPARRLDILERPTIISVTYVHSGESDQKNLIPNMAEFGGTIRSFVDLDDRGPNGESSTREILEQYTSGMAAALGVKCSLSLTKGPPPTVNNEALFLKVVPPLQSVWTGTVNTSARRGMFAEDFAFYTRDIPSLYFGLGIAKGNLGKVDVHKSEFTIHPDAFAEGIRLLVLLAQLGSGGPAQLK
jgi:amidohydrolase